MRHPQRRTGRRPPAVLSLLLIPLLTGCGQRDDPLPPVAAASLDTIAPGVRHVAEPVGPGGGVDLIAVTLPNPAVRLEIASRNASAAGGVAAADPRLPRDWVEAGALAAINGGYFGRDLSGGRREIVGLFGRRGRVVRAAPLLTGHGAAGLRAAQFARSAFGLLPGGVPSIAWAATDPKDPDRIYAYTGPTVPPSARRGRWEPVSVVGCGPTLIRDGRTVVTDRQERLASDDPRPRTFVAYDMLGGQPGHFILGISSPMAYSQVASYLLSYYRRRYGTSVSAAMCLDGGSSTQLSYRQAGRILSPRDTGVSVPDCIAVVPARMSLR